MSEQEIYDALDIEENTICDWCKEKILKCRCDDDYQQEADEKLLDENND